MVTASRPSMPRIWPASTAVATSSSEPPSDVSVMSIGPLDFRVGQMPERVVLGHVGERGFDDVTDDERGGDDGRAEECPGDDQDSLRAAAADVAQGHREEGPLAQRRDRKRSKQQERDDPEDREGGHAITGSAARCSSSVIGSPSWTTSPSRTCTRRCPDRPMPSSWVTTTRV